MYIKDKIISLSLDEWNKREKRKNTSVKFLYFIIIKWHNQDVFKLGITNSPIRRMKEYRNSESIGYLKEIIDVYKVSNPEELETLLKWTMKSIGVKPLFKQEYFPLEYKDFIIKQSYKLAKQFDLKMVKCKIEDVLMTKIMKRNKPRNEEK